MLEDSRNYFIKDIFEKAELTVRAFNICCDLDIKTLNDLHNFIKSNKGFQKVRNCGYKTALELLDFHKKYYLNSKKKPDSKDVYLNKFIFSDEKNLNKLINSEFQKLSPRARNALFYFFNNKVPNINDIKIKFIDNKFYSSKLLNIGGKSLIEIEFFAQMTIDLVNTFESKDSLDHNFEVSDSVDIDTTESIQLNNLIESKLNKIIATEFQGLSPRAFNALFKYFGDEVPTKQSIIDNFITHKFYPTKLRNVGSKTISEIDSFIEKVIIIINESANTQISLTELAKTNLNQISGIENIENDYVLCFEKKKFPIIKFVAENLSKILNINNVDIYIFKNYLGLLSNHYNRQEIGNKFGLSPERVRQKQEVIIEKSRFTIYKSIINLLSSSEYGNLLNNFNIFSFPVDIKNELILEEINNNGVEFSFYIFSIIFKEDYFSINPFDRIDRPDRISREANYLLFKNIKGNYLFRKELILKEDLIKIYNVILKELCQIHDCDLFLNISEIISKKITAESEIVIKKFIEAEFGLQLNSFFIIIPKNSITQVYEYTEIALNEIDHMATLEELMAKLIKLYPYKKFMPDSVRNQIARFKDIFIIERRQISLYGLKKWETEKDGVKGGTIGDIAVEFILKNSKPCTFKEIVNHVSKYRANTNEKSILTTLKVGYAKKQLVFYKGGIIGIRDEFKKNKLLGYTEVTIDELINDLFDY